MPAPYSLPAAWLVLAFGDERQYAGNAGYDDVAAATYRYDSSVPNHTRVAKDDVLLIRGPNRLDGCARIEVVHTEEGTKERLRCPTCRTTAIKAREHLSPRFRCDKGHVFELPSSEQVAVTKYTAEFGACYLPAFELIPLSELREACPNWNGQLAIQALDLSVVHSQLVRLPGYRERILERRARPTLSAADASIVGGQASLPRGPSFDNRSISYSQVRSRRGDGAFRRQLMERYGGKCVVSGCELEDLLEAAHIDPYGAINADGPGNGLLLRADLHTLFDLDLIGVHPETFVVHVSSTARAQGYEQFHGEVLRCSDVRPATASLSARWPEYLFRTR